MSKASVAQEPSMDEILASIRRIIETGDERDKASAPSVPKVGGFGNYRIGSPFAETRSGETTSAEPPLTAAVVPASDAPMDEAAAEHSSSLPEWPHAVRTQVSSSIERGAFDQAPKASALDGADDDRLTAELESELAATWDRVEHPVHAGGELRTADPQLGDADVEDERAEAMPIENEQQARSSAVDVFASDASASGEVQARPDTHAQDDLTHEHSPVERASFQPANTDRRFDLETRDDDAPAFDGRPGPLASDTTSSLVGASFNELAEAIRSGELRSLEAMAQDMLAPLLREWLDDNLPRMVERLVREEIDRMSRGGRR